MTILKIRTSKLQKGEEASFSPVVWQIHKHTDFGMHSFPHLELSSMMEEGEDGFYKCEGYIPLTVKPKALQLSFLLSSQKEEQDSS